MQQLLPAQYPNVLPLYARLQYNLVIDSIIAGNTRGGVYVDQVAQPRFAILWNKQDTLLLAGPAPTLSFRNELGDLLCTKILPKACQMTVPEIAFLFTPLVWEPYVAEILAGINFKKASRRFYASHKLKPNWNARLLPGFTMAALDLELLKNDDLNGIDSIHNLILSRWETPQSFYSTGFGYCIISQGQITSWCLTVYASGRQYELKAETHREYRNQGLGTVATAACLAHCDTHGYTPHWHCWESNRAAIAVAQKAGFDRPMGYSAHRILL